MHSEASTLQHSTIKLHSSRLHESKLHLQLGNHLAYHPSPRPSRPRVNLPLSASFIASAWKIQPSVMILCVRSPNIPWSVFPASDSSGSTASSRFHPRLSPQQKSSFRVRDSSIRFFRIHAFILPFASNPSRPRPYSSPVDSSHPAISTACERRIKKPACYIPLGWEGKGSSHLKTKKKNREREKQGSPCFRK